MSGRQERLLDLLERWCDGQKNGQPPDVAQLCADCPELADDLRRQIDLNKRLEQAARPASCLIDTSGHGGSSATQQWEAGQPTPQVAGYEELSWLGGGGMGTVYRALDTRLGRQVALKLVRGEDLTPTMLARLQAEARAVAQLDHPHIVKVFEVGQCRTAEGQTVPYLALEYVAGGSLEKRLGSQALAPGEAARLVRLLTGAMQHAHAKGIVHRDLKPDNVLLAPPADVPALNTALGCPKVTDFGLARQLSGDDRLTRTGSVMGTPAYMAPEQADGSRDVGPAADVYALGAILYRLLAGKLPFEGESIVDVLYKARHQEPEPIRRSQPRVPAELEAICLECLHKLPGRRPTAARLAERLDGFLGGQNDPATASWLTAGKGWGWRPSRRQLLVGGLAGMVALGGGAVWWLRQPGGWRQEGPTGGTAPLPLKGFLDLEMTRPDDPLRQLLPLRDPASRPLRTGDEVRIRAELNRPAFAYLLWIDTRGEVVPLYPWVEGDWGRRAREEAQQQLRLPRRKGGGWGWWPLDPGPAGLETLVLLTRETPLPGDADLKDALAGLGRQGPADREGLSVAWFENGQIVRDEPLRAPNLKGVREGSSPLERMNREVQSRVGRHFVYTRAVTFGNRGNEEPR